MIVAILLVAVVVLSVLLFRRRAEDGQAEDLPLMVDLRSRLAGPSTNGGGPGESPVTHRDEASSRRWPHADDFETGHANGRQAAGPGRTPKHPADARDRASAPGSNGHGTAASPFAAVFAGTSLAPAGLRAAPGPEKEAVTPPAAPADKASEAEPVAPQPVDFDGTLQLLPGRLEALTGGVDKEIRFIKIPGVDVFTFGRSTGPEYTHVQLNAPSVSRKHGYMAFESGHWRIGNLSRTNCVIVNGSPVDDEVGRWLKDGDRIEFGEVAFAFRTR